MKEVIEEWLNKAESDLEVCRELLNRKRFADIAAFHAQQAAEKYLKALWEFFGIDVVKAHDLYFLKEGLIGKTTEINELRDEDLYFLTEFAVDFRYPGESATVKEARKAYKIALKVRGVVLNVLESKTK